MTCATTGFLWGESILRKWLYYSKQFTDSMQSLSITNGIFLRNRTEYFTIYMETQKTPNSQRNLKKERQGWRNQPSWLQTILQSYYNQDSIVLAQKQKYRSKKQDRKPRDRPLHLWAPYLWQKSQEHAMEKRQPLQ